jgi:GGDEF domain-containing protein
MVMISSRETSSIWRKSNSRGWGIGLEGGQQRRLRLEVGVDGAHRAVDPLGHRLHREVAHAVLGEDGAGGLDELLVSGGAVARSTSGVDHRAILNEIHLSVKSFWFTTGDQGPDRRDVPTADPSAPVDPEMIPDVSLFRCRSARWARQDGAVHVDPATGLPGRDSVIDRLDELLGGGRRPAVFVVAIHGYPDLAETEQGAADAVARELAGRLSLLVRHSDLLAVLSPGIFVLVSPGVDPSDQPILLERVQGAFALPVSVAGAAVSFPVTVGVAHGVHGMHAPGVLADAESDLRRRLLDR